MALPMLQVSAVLTNLVCTKVPLPSRPQCYRDPAGPFPQKYKCCPLDYVFINYERICSCVPKTYAEKLRDRKLPRQRAYNDRPVYRTQGNNNFKSYGYTQGSINKYGYSQKKKYNNGNLPSQNSRRKTRYPVPSESTSNRVRATPTDNRYQQDRQRRQRLQGVARGRTGLKQLSGRRNVPVKTVYESSSPRQLAGQQRGNGVPRSRTTSVTPQRKSVYVIRPNRGQGQSAVPATAEVQDRQIVTKIGNSKRTSIPNTGPLANKLTKHKGPGVNHVQDRQTLTNIVNSKRTSIPKTGALSNKRTEHIGARVKHKTTLNKSVNNSYIQNNAKSTKSHLSSQHKKAQIKKTISKIHSAKTHSANSIALNHSAQNLISNSRNSQRTRNIPIYFLNYNLINGDVVHMPVIYEYQPALPTGVDRAIPLPDGRGFLVPISLFVMTSGRFVYNPEILRRHPSLLSRIRLARQRGISIEPIPLKRDIIQSRELSTYLNARSHPFDDIILEHPVTTDPLHDVVPMEVHEQAPKSQFLGSSHGNAGSKVQRLINGKGSSSNNILLSLSKVRTHPAGGTMNDIKDAQAAIVDTIRNKPRLLGNSANLQLQNLRAISNRDFIDKSSRVRQTFHPNWIPDLELFRMLAGFPANPPSNPLSKGGQQTTFKSKRVDLHNIISNIPLDSRFDLKTDILGRPMPDIPGPLSLRRQNQGKNHFLHLTGIHKGPVAFPSEKSSPQGIKTTLSGSTRPVPAGIVKNSENSVPILSTGFVDGNSTNAVFPATSNTNPGVLNPVVPKQTNVLFSATSDTNPGALNPVLPKQTNVLFSATSDTNPGVLNPVVPKQTNVLFSTTSDTNPGGLNPVFPKQTNVLFSATSDTNPGVLNPVVPKQTNVLFSATSDTNPGVLNPVVPKQTNVLFSTTSDTHPGVLNPVVPKQTNVLFSTTSDTNSGALNPVLPNIVIPKDTHLDSHNKVVLKFQGVSVQHPKSKTASPSYHPPNPLTGITGPKASSTIDQSTLNSGTGTSNIKQPYNGHNSILPDPKLGAGQIEVPLGKPLGVNASGKTKKTANSRTPSGNFPNPLAGKTYSLDGASKPSAAIGTGKAKIQLNLNGHPNHVPNQLTRNGTPKFNKIPNPSAGKGDPHFNVNNIPYLLPGTENIVTPAAPKRISGQGTWQKTTGKSSGLLGRVPDPLIGSMDIAVTGMQSPSSRTRTGPTATQGKSSGNARRPEDGFIGRMGSTATRLLEHSIRNRENSLFSKERLPIPVRKSQFKIPFNPRILTKQGAFTYRTFFNLRPTGPNTGSTSDRNGVIGIINGNTKVYPIPIFPGAINGNMGEPVYNSLDQSLDIFSGQEFSPFLDPTTNLPVGFTVRKFNNEVGGIVDLVQNGGQLKKADAGHRPGSATKQNRPGGTGVYRLLENDGVIREIVTVLRRNRKTAGPNGNELVIPPEIIGEKARNDIVMYLEDVKSSKSLAKKPSNESVPTDLVKLLRNPVFVRYINNKTQETTPNTMDVSDQLNTTLIVDRISVSRDPIPLEAEKAVPVDKLTSFTKSNTKVLNSKSNDAMVFLTAKPIPPAIHKARARVPMKEDAMMVLPPVPLLKFDSVELVLPKPLKMNLTKELCRGCTIDGGLGYANHPSRCDHFVVCYPGEGGNLVPIEQQCPFGLFWSQNALTCRLPKDVKCPHDICLKKKELHQYPHEDNCQSYWECQRGYSVPKCCPLDTAFREGRGCVGNDGSCRSRCPVGDSEIQPLYWQGKCDKRAVPGNRKKFERHVYYESNAGVAGRIQEEWMIQECSPGTEFHPEVCDCRVSGDLAALSKAKRVCSPEVYLPFTHDLKDESSSRTHVRADNVSLTTSGTACFIGRSVLAMPKFANMDLGSYLYVKIRYRHSSVNPKNEVLLYNGDCERKPSLILGSTADGNFVSVVSTTGEQHTLHVKSSVPATEWRTVSLVINSGHVQVTSDTMTEQKTAFGVLERAQCGMKLGWGEGYEQFNGCIDDFILYRCKHEGEFGSKG